MDERRTAIVRAAGGTLLIERIDLLSDSVRQALVRAIEDGSTARPGDGHATPLDARIIATASDEVGALFGDLAVQTVSLPGLDERHEDILPLAAHFLASYAAACGDYHLFGVVDWFASYRAAVRAKVAAMGCVTKAARDGEQTGEFEYQSVKRAPDAAKASRWGVRKSVAPMHDKSP